MTDSQFWKLGHKITGHKLSASKKIGLRRFKAFFGVSPAVCKIVWDLIGENRPHDSQPKHLLWALNFLKQYNTEHTNRQLFHADEKTVRKWVWCFVTLISELDIIDFENRKQNSKPGQKNFVSLDGVDFKILEPRPYSTKWYSHKFRSSGLRYEIGLCIRTGRIVWQNGGFPCGAFPDLKIAYQEYTHIVDSGEKTVADKGYNNNLLFILPTANNSETHNTIMSRHETVNKRIRHFNVLKSTFRHNLRNHKFCFGAVLNLTEIVIENEQPLFSIM